MTLPFYPDVSLSRRTDPSTSAEAGESIRPALDELAREIRRASERLGPTSAEELAYEVERWWPARWMHSSIVSACSPEGSKGNRSGLRVAGYKRNARGRRVQILELP